MATPIIDSSHRGPARVASWKPLTTLESRSVLWSDLSGSGDQRLPLLKPSTQLNKTLGPHFLGPTHQTWSPKPFRSSSESRRAENCLRNTARSSRVR